MPRGRVSSAKSTILKSCENPKCKKGIGGKPKKFWGHVNYKYCCQECREIAKRIRLNQRRV